jgi:hypothetical protein
LIDDYLNQKTDLAALYHRFPTLENFEKQLKEKHRVALKLPKNLILVVVRV